MSNFKIQNADREPNLDNYIIPDYVKRTVAVDLGSNLCLFEKKYHDRFDEIFEILEIERINYLKIDVEGAEHSILMNCDLSKVDFIAAEIHNIMGIDKMDEVRNKILETHEIVSQIKANPDVRNEETNFKLRG